MKQRNANTVFLRQLFSLSTGIVVLLLGEGGGIVPVQAGAFAAEASTQAVDKTIAVPSDAVEPMYNVVSPLGDSPVKMITMAPRLNTLAGKTVCMVWNHAFKADITLPAIAESLKNEHPNIKIISYTEIDAAIQAAGRENPAAEEAVILGAVLKQKGCEALISGNGG